MEEDFKDKNDKTSKKTTAKVGMVLSIIGLVLCIGSFFVEFFSIFIFGYPVGIVFGIFPFGMMLLIIGSLVSSIGKRKLIDEKVDSVFEKVLSTDKNQNGDKVIVGDNDELYERKCPFCGCINTGTAKFCNSCGRQFPNILNTENDSDVDGKKGQNTNASNFDNLDDEGKKICKNCGWHNEKEDKFCRDCGKKL